MLINVEIVMSCVVGLDATVAAKKRSMLSLIDSDDPDMIIEANARIQRHTFKLPKMSLDNDISIV